jgi:glycosyltransferase involved in cell wall biosynthesis
MLRTAIDALRRQTYRRFELLVQDGGSTDGGLAYLHSIADLPKLEIVSEPDTGIGQAYNRGLARCRGDLVMLVSCDEALDEDALQKGVDWFSNDPEAAVVCGAMRLADAEGRILQVFIPPAFDFNKVLHNETVPPACAAFLNRSKIGGDLYYDESLKTCPDYDLWLRLGSRFKPAEIVMLPDPIVVARSDRASMSYRAESFDQFCRDKLFVLNRYLDSCLDSADFAALRRTASAGILTWAAENVLALEGVSESFLKWCAAATKFDPSASRLLRLQKQTLAFTIEPSTGRFSLASDVQPDLPPGQTECADTPLRLEELHALGQNATVGRGDTVRVVTGRVPWNYTAEIPLLLSTEMDRDRWYWARLNVRVLSGQIGVGILVENDIYNERLIGAEDGRTEVLIKISHPSARALMIRNGSFPASSVLEIFGATVESFPRPNRPETD